MLSYVLMLSFVMVIKFLVIYGEQYFYAASVEDSLSRLRRNLLVNDFELFRALYIHTPVTESMTPRVILSRFRWKICGGSGDYPWPNYIHVEIVPVVKSRESVWQNTNERLNEISAILMWGKQKKREQDMICKMSA